MNKKDVTFMQSLSKSEMVEISGGMSARQERWARSCMRAGCGGSVFQTLGHLVIAIYEMF